MKRLKDIDILPLITSHDNLRASIDAVLAGTHRKLTSQGREALAYTDRYEDWLAAEISAGSFYLTTYGHRIINERGKTRKIQYLLSYYEKMGVHAIMTVLEELTYKRLIRTTAASIKKRGVHDLLNIIRRDIAANPNIKYVYEDDITKFYESIIQDVMMDVLRKLIKGPKTLRMLECFVRLLASGLSIGLRSSQHFGNLLLSVAIDHLVKSTNRTKYYYRYCDDKRVFGETKQEVWQAASLIQKQVQSIGLKVKPNYKVYPIEQGIDFLGYNIYKDFTRVRKRNKQRTARRLKKIKSKSRRREIIASFYSLCKHADAKHLFKKITGIAMAEYQEFKSLAEIGIKGSRRNHGRKQFRCKSVAQSALYGTTMCVIDFQENVSTQWSRLEMRKAQELGDNSPEKTKYVICARVITPNKAHLLACNVILKKGDVFKFFTGYEDIWDICEQLKEKGMLGQNKVTLDRDTSGNFTEYYFR
jgi:hypothetical protein